VNNEKLKSMIAALFEHIGLWNIVSILQVLTVL